MRVTTKTVGRKSAAHSAIITFRDGRISGMLFRCRTTDATESRDPPNFFTVNLLDRRSDLLVMHIDALRDAVRKVRERSPFHIDA
jgi:hypothetical protein